ncbi:methyl-accepting chemotaxis protein [Pectinatus brassicae]|uniref:Methyl-accepting chemotaxis protein n=1 Tax=Pectinatus brassicae TaxID=862415 RepID=A0A840UQF8_9FIRM|nr:methyl-accepting chemotaxis protein [Pectinatus brassicae]MBB5335064.1 methyl-accepting chemotaxis protein [Pectinatus brassicae]
MNLKVRMYISYAIVIVLTGIVGVFSLYSLNNVNARLTELGTERVPRIMLMADINQEVSSYLAAQQNILLHTDSNAVNEMKQSEKNIDSNFKKLYDTSLASYKPKIESTQGKWVAYKKASNERVRMVLAGQDHESPAVEAKSAEVEKIGKDLNSDIDGFFKASVVATDKNVADGKAEYTKAKWMTTVGLFIVLILGMIIATIVTRYMDKFIKGFLEVSQKVAEGDLKQRIEFASEDEFGQMAQAYNKTIDNIKNLIQSIQKTANEVVNTVNQVATGANQSADAIQNIAQSVSVVAESADKQAQGINESTNNTEKITNYIKAVSTDTEATAADAEKALMTANEGTQIMFSTIEQMKVIEDTTQRSSTVVSTLGERSKEIGQIVDTISGIAGQTNLLALNAAIEAARAGEQGKGFAVVAEEVRKLAEQSQDAAQQIAELIGRIQTETQEAVDAISSGTGEVQQGIDSVNKSGKAFSDIMQTTAAVAMQVREMSETMSEVAKNGENVLAQMQGVDDETKIVAREMETTSAATQEQSASMEEIAASCQNLRDLADKLFVQSNNFKI